MRFVDREEELARLDRLAGSEDGGLAVVYGRRRIGKTRLLLEWAAKHRGLYTVADRSTPEIQRRYLAEAAAERCSSAKPSGAPSRSAGRPSSAPCGSYGGGVPGTPGRA